MPLIYKPIVKQIPGRIGIIPHYKDIDNPNVKRLLSEQEENTLLIRVQGYHDWKDVICKILSCDYVISSSLHGLILSDAYNIPNLWVSFSDLLAGGSFKFKDYYSSVNKDAFTLKVTSETSINDLLKYNNKYKQIMFDPRPLLMACPFKIIHPNILGFLNSE